MRRVLAQEDLKGEHSHRGAAQRSEKEAVAEQAGPLVVVTREFGGQRNTWNLVKTEQQPDEHQENKEVAEHDLLRPSVRRVPYSIERDRQRQRRGVHEGV